MEKRKRRFGDRPDGRKLRSLPPLTKIIPYLMRSRTGAQNYASTAVAAEPINEYIRAKRAAGLQNYGFLHLFISAYLRVLCRYPGLNRFVSGQKIFARNRIQVLFVAKKEMTIAAEESIMKLEFERTDTPEQVFEKVNRAVSDYRNTEEDDLGKLINVLNYIPGLLLKFTVWLLRVLDYFGLLPRKLLDLSPFHGSLFFTDLGSLGVPPVQHHLYNFGNIPFFCAFGSRRRELKLRIDGSTERKTYYDVIVTMDERICDGFYLSSAIKYFARLMKDPFLLDLPPEELVEDID